MSGMRPGRLTNGLYLHAEDEEGRKFAYSLVQVSWSNESLLRNSTGHCQCKKKTFCFQALVVSPACGCLVMLAEADEGHDLSHWAFHLKMRCACLLDRRVCDTMILDFTVNTDPGGEGRIESLANMGLSLHSS